jgi:carbon monoxide dehydrogenase subunit G
MPRSEAHSDIIDAAPKLPGYRRGAVEIEVSILVDAPRDDVFAILTDYGAEVRRRINPELKFQEIVERHGNVVVCENEWERRGKSIRQRRQYTITPPDRIHEEVIGARTNMAQVITRVEPEGEQTRLTLTTVYRLSGIWWILARLAAPKLRESDEELLQTLKAGIEAEFEDVPEE